MAKSISKRRSSTASRSRAFDSRVLRSNELKKFMVATAVGAGAVLRKYFGKVKHIERKPGAGIVTEADKQAEKYVLQKIFKVFPNSSIITEETGEYRKDDSLCWILDPLDGTTNYAHGFPWFCVSIGLHQDGQPRAGIIYQPVTGDIFFAEAGKGSTLNGKCIRVSTTNVIQDSLLGTGFYYAKGSDLNREMQIFGRVQEKALGVRRPGSAALDLAYVACGRYDGFWERGLNCWDVAAGALLVTEAGGQVSDYSGKTFDAHGAEIVATNGGLHSPILSLIHG